MAETRKDIPTPGSSNFDTRMREAMMTYMGKLGDKLDRGVTIRDLLDAGMITLRPGWQNGGSNLPPVVGPGPGPGGSGPPPTPTGLTLTGAVSHIIIECDPQRYTQGGGHARTRVYGIPVPAGGPEPTFADAVEICDFDGTVFAYASNPSQNWRIWIRWQSRAGLLSPPAGGLHGQPVETGKDVRTLLDAVTAAALDPGAPYTKFAVRAGLFYVASDTGPTDEPIFAVVTNPIVVGGVLVPAGVYLADAFIMNGTITNAKIANLAVDDAKIATLSAAKIISGSIDVGQYIQSTNFISGSGGQGWRIDGAGNLEASNAILRGLIYASGGTIGGIVIDAHEIRSSNYNAGTGVGFSLRDDGTLNLPSGSITAANLNVTSLSAISATLGNVRAGSVRNGDFTGYNWPAAGGTGFYLGPEGLLIGNANDGRYVRITDQGNIYMPGMYVENGQLYFQQANVIDTNNIVIGAVTIGLSATGTDDASIFFTVPPGETWNILLVASCMQSTNVIASVGGSAAEDCVRTSTISIDGAVVETLPLQNTTSALSPIFGPYYYFSQLSTYKALSLGAGAHSINAHCAYDTYPLYDSPVSIIGYAFKR